MLGLCSDYARIMLGLCYDYRLGYAWTMLGLSWIMRGCMGYAWIMLGLCCVDYERIVLCLDKIPVYV